MDSQKERHSASQLHLNMNGHLNLFSGPDENAERQRTYNEAKQKWPVDQKGTSCETLQAIIDNIQLSINSAMQTKAIANKAGTTRVQNRIIDGYTWWQNDVKSIYNLKQCEKIQAEQEQKEFFDTQYENLEKVQGLSQAAGSTTKYVVLGMLGLTVVVAGIILFKKK